ncbi:hypothetical protein H0H87_002350 [Tephrocybe sp. NHM501043]|nr:hypothetical protein H0H87_002350 [Tephrocybe sp. NHM501043]
MAQTTRKSKCSIIQSNSKSSQDKQPVPKHARHAVKLLAKVVETDKENLKKAQAKIAKLKKKMLKYQTRRLMTMMIQPLQHMPTPGQIPVHHINLAQLNQSTTHHVTKITAGA